MQVILLLSIFLTTSVVLFLLVRYSHYIGMIDNPNERSAHKQATPRSGGIAIFVGLILGQTLFNFPHFAHYYYIYAAISIVFFIGFLDDRYDTSPRLKFLFILIASGVLYFNGISIHSLGTYFGYQISLPIWLIFPFTFFAIAGFTNALNLMDGLDGLAGSLALIILSAYLVVGIMYEDHLMMTLSISLMVAIGAFLIFNWNPASIFMGDSGSLTIGFTIALLSILSLQYITPTSVLFIIALPLLDTFIVMTRRLQRGISPFTADKNHLHHFLLNVKADVRFVVILLLSIQGAFTLIGFQLRHADCMISLVLFTLLFFIFLHLFDQRLKHRRKHKVSKKRLRAIHRKKSQPFEEQKPTIVSEEQPIPAIITPRAS